MEMLDVAEGQAIGALPRNVSAISPSRSPTASRVPVEGNAARPRTFSIIVIIRLK